MPFNLDRLQLARMQVDVNYHVAFTYWSLKGVIAERWGHGPLFGSFVDLGNQVTLSRAPEHGIPRNDLQAYYGIQASGFNAEPVSDRKAAQVDAVSWIGDVLTVLKPQRVVRVLVNLLGLYPVTNIRRASERLRERFYNEAELRKVLPTRDEAGFHSAIESILVDGDRQTTIVVGAVGPPHKGFYFATPNEERDNRWWMGVRAFGVIARDEDGISDASAELRRLLDQTYADYMRAARTSLPTIVG
jgi:hypothetical protein